MYVHVHSRNILRICKNFKRKNVATAVSVFIPPLNQCVMRTQCTIDISIIYIRVNSIPYSFNRMDCISFRIRAMNHRLALCVRGSLRRLLIA